MPQRIILVSYFFFSAISAKTAERFTAARWTSKARCDSISLGDQVDRFRFPSLLRHVVIFERELLRILSPVHENRPRWMVRLSLPGSTFPPLNITKIATFRMGHPPDLSPCLLHSRVNEWLHARLAWSTGTSGGAGFLCRKALRGWHDERCCSCQVVCALLDGRRVGLQSRWQTWNRLIRLFEIERAR